MVGTGRFELPTCRLGGDRSIHLSYVPEHFYCTVISMRYLLLLALAARIGIIDFFGYEGVDTRAIRAALPFKEGARSGSLKGRKDAARQAAKRVTGHEPSDVAMVCCDEQGNWIVFIGIAGAAVRYNPPPAGTIRLPSEAVKLYDAILKAVESTAKSRDPGGDRSLRARELALRDWALRNEVVVVDVLENSANAEDRAIAAMALGYGRQNEKTFAALTNAGFDANGTTRNNAIRALGVLVNGNPELARYVPADRFVGLLHSGTWTDRNKASFLFLALTKSRDRALLDALRAQAFGALVEMARWRSSGHATPARMVLGRLTGIPEERLSRMIEEPEAIIRAAQEAQRLKPLRPMSVR